ncbi:MAG: hypothetical protein PHV59_11830 [Victivallales bacterium]|nr:hypothetical protein [Victivallales bacterium]
MLTALAKHKIIPVLNVKDLASSHALHLCEALAKAGLPLLETAFRRHGDSLLLKAIKKEFPDFITWASGILNCEQFLRAAECGINFASAPGICPRTMAAAAATRITFIPGAMTPAEIHSILLHGLADFQFFHTGASGGPDYLQAVLEPFRHLPLDIFPHGSISLKQAGQYLKISNVTAVALEEILPPEYISAQKWDKIFDLAGRAVEYLNS